MTLLSECEVLLAEKWAGMCQAGVPKVKIEEGGMHL